MTNTQRRIDRAKRTLAFYAGTFGGKKDTPAAARAYVKREADYIVVDAIADLLHYAASQPWAAEHIARDLTGRALDHFDHESRLETSHRSQSIMEQ